METRTPPAPPHDELARRDRRGRDHRRGAMGSALLIFGEHLVEPVVRADLGWMAVSL